MIVYRGRRVTEAWYFKNMKFLAGWGEQYTVTDSYKPRVPIQSWTTDRKVATSFQVSAFDKRIKFYPSEVVNWDYEMRQAGCATWDEMINGSWTEKNLAEQFDKIESQPFGFDCHKWLQKFRDKKELVYPVVLATTTKPTEFIFNPESSHEMFGYDEGETIRFINTPIQCEHIMNGSISVTIKGIKRMFELLDKYSLNLWENVAKFSILNKKSTLANEFRRVKKVDPASIKTALKRLNRAR